MSKEWMQVCGLSLCFPHKICFENFSTWIPAGTRVGIVGPNGAGKSSLLEQLHSPQARQRGQVKLSAGCIVGRVPQLIGDFPTLSGAERFQKAFEAVWSQSPHLLLLDEPSNHLDVRHRLTLLRKLNDFGGILLVISHDSEFLTALSLDQVWELGNGGIRIFSGPYPAYLQEQETRKTALEKEAKRLDRQQKQAHADLLREQLRAKKSKIYGQKKYAGDKLARNAAAAQGQSTANQNRKRITEEKTACLEALAQLQIPEVLVPRFSLTAKDFGKSGGTLAWVHGGTVGYAGLPSPCLHSINFSIQNGERLALAGPNGSGKSTFLKALAGQPGIQREGLWELPPTETIGYLDQHYQGILPKGCALSELSQTVPHWPQSKLREHLSAFLFRKNEAVHTPVEQLSGGERARLCLAKIAAQTPRLLLLDEVSNNLDAATRGHLIDVLKVYPGALVVVSHDSAFLKALGVKIAYQVQDGTLRQQIH